jgi:hypothetical protein
MPWSLSRQARAAERIGLTILTTVPTGERSGVVLTVRPDTPGVLGLGAVDQFGETAALALDVEETRALRDALSAWLDGA